MSLVNDMLRDLEARRAGDLGAPSLQREVRALPPERKTPGRAVAIVLILALALAVGGLGWRLALKPEAPPVAQAANPPVSPNPVPAPPAVADIPPAAPLPAPAPAAPPPPATSPADVPLPMAVDTRLSLARGLGGLPSEPPSRPPPPAEPPRVPEAPASPAKLEPPAKPLPAAVAGAGAASIEKTAIVSSPRERAEAEYRRAQAQLAAGQISPAAETLAAALRQDPAHAAARQALLRLLLQAQRLDEAAGLLNEGLDVLPAQVGWAMTLARLQVEKGELTAAEHTLARSASHALSQADYAGFHGHILTRLGQSRAAVERYELATRLDAGEGRWWFGLGQALEADGRSPEARDAYRRALTTGTLSGELAALAESRLR